MKKTYLFLCAAIIVICSGNRIAEANNTWVTASGLTSATSELVMYRNTLSFGTSGYLEKSIDTGKTWTQLTGGGSRAWNVFAHAIAASADGQKVWATTCATQCSDYVYYSTDGGTTWASSTVLGPSISWWKIASSADGTNLILQTTGSTLVSTSSGATWTTVLNSIGDGTVAISPDGATMVSVNSGSADGSVNISTDSGATWTAVSAITSKGSSAAVGNNGIIYIGTTDNYIYRSSNYGASWTSLKFAGMNSWDDLAISDDGVHILALGNVALYYSDDSGASWYQGSGGGQWRLWYAPDGSKAYYSSGLAYVPIPAITTQSVSSITATGATLNATVANDFAFQYSTSAEGFSYGTTNAYGSDASTTGTFTAGAYSQNITGLTCNTTYFYRAYATNANGTGTASSTYFTTLPCSGAFVTDKRTIPTSGSTVIQLTGNSTGWTAGTPGSPTFTVSGVSGTSISSQTVTDATHASITVTTGTATGTLTITDPNNATSQTVSVVQATDVIAANNSHVIYSPGNTYDSGTGVQMMHTGSSAKFAFTGSTLKLDADLSTLISSGAAFANYPFINWKIDGGAWQRAQLQPDSGTYTQVMTLASGLSSGSHSAQVYYEQGGVEDSWPANSLVKITGWEIESGKSVSTPTYADGLRPKRMMILGDSITRGYSAETDSSGVDHTGTGQTYVQDSWGMLFGQKLDAEVGIKAYSGQGYRKIGAAPYVTATFDYVDSQHAQPLPSDLDYLVIAQGANDYQTDITSSVKELLTLARAQVGPSTKIFLMPSFLTLTDSNANPEITTEIQAGLAAYQAAYPSDTQVYFFNIGDIFGAVDPYQSTTYMLGDIHPNHAGHALLATDVANIAVGYAPTVISSIATSSGASSVTITWNTDRSADSLVNYGTSASYTSSSTYTSTKTLTHSVVIAGLSPSQTYHFQIASVDTASSTATSSDFTIRTTGSAVLPTLATSSPTSITLTSVTLNASITADGGDASSDVGFEYGLTSSYGSVASTTGSFGAGSFSKSITGLTANTTYHYRAFATNFAGTATTTDQTFTTSAQSVFAPTLTTSESSSVTTTGLTLNANISSTGGEDPSEHGFAYGITADLSTVIATTSLGSFTGTGSFTQNITSLTPNTTYYFRAYAVNSAGTSTGAILSTTTRAVIIANAPTLIQSTSAYPAGTTASLAFTTDTTPGDLIVVAVGDAINHGAGGQHSVTDSQGNVYTLAANQTASGLSEVSIFYAKNITGGPDTVTVTLSNPTYDLAFHISEWAGLDTTNPFVASSTNAGNSSSWSTGDLTVTDPSNLIYAALNDETGSGGPLTAGSGFTLLTQELGEMSATEYQITSTSGTYPVAMSGNFTSSWAMGSVAFKAQTQGVAPITLTTSAPSSVTTTGFTLNANISDNGGVDATEHGFTYSTSPTLSTGSATTTLGSFTGTGSFTDSITGLTPNTTYYFRAYAVNSAGTSTGAILSTTTAQVVVVPTVTVQSASTVSSTTATLNGTITATGGANALARGFNYGTAVSYGATSTASGSFGTGAYTADVTSLTCNTLYHVRAYAQNSAGYAYSSDSTFTTGACSSGDTTSPTITTFSIPSTASALSVSITAFTATDDTAVTGYLLSESATTPLASDSGWVSSAPTTYTFGSSGTKTLYAWTKDAAGNISAAATGSVTITISSGGGGGGGTTSGSSGGGGGGTAGGSGLTPLAPAATTTSFTLPMKKLVYPAQYQFARTLSLGSLGVDVKALQEFLNVNGYYVSTSGLGAPGFETTYFGPATDAALKKFQCAMILICTGDPGSSGYGATGSFTRMILNGAIVPIVATPASATAIPSLPVKNTLPTNVGGTVSSYLYLGATGQQVKALQQMLNAKGYTVALSGAGSPGNETAYFGPATSLALKKFQCAMISVCSGGPLVNGYGATGPRTRAALAGTVIPSTTSIAPKTQAPVPKTTASAPVKTTPITQPKPVVVPTIDFGF